jgi:hypothetical protein
MLGIGSRAAVTAHKYLAASGQRTGHSKSRSVNNVSVFGKKCKAELCPFLSMFLYDLKSG